MKRYLWLGLTAVILAGCSQEESLETPDKDAGVLRYMAVSLHTTNADNTRTEDGSEDKDVEGNTYNAGIEDEFSLATDDVVFFLFNEDGTPYTQTISGGNCIAELYDDGATDSWTTNSENQVRDGKDYMAVIHLKSAEVAMPTKVVAVVNAGNHVALGITETVTLDNLRKTVLSGSDNYSGAVNTFAMTNSVYRNESESKSMYYTPISAENLSKTPAGAKEKSVDVYVERVVAKVTAQKQVGREFTLDKVNFYDNPSSVETSGELKVKITGWKLFNKAATTYLEKDIEDLNTSEASWGWNAESLKRSFWANVPQTLAIGEDKLTWQQMKQNGNETAEYAFENTLLSRGTDDVCTSILFSGTIYEKLADGTTDTDASIETDAQGAKWKPLDFIYWKGRYFRTKEAVKAYCAGMLSEDVSTTAGTMTQVTANDIIFKTLSNGYQLQPSVNKTLYSPNTSEELTEDALENVYAEIPDAQIWNKGRCYYFTEIRHPKGDQYVNALVRNHWYRVDISTITGLGTPIPGLLPEDGDDNPDDVVDENGDPYDPEDLPPFDPVRPKDETYNTYWFMNANVIIEPWRVVTKEVTIETEE